MTSFIVKTAFATLATLAALGATSQANAANVDFDIRVHTPHVVVREPVVVVRPAYRQQVVVVRPRPVVVVRQDYGYCSAGLALEKASYQGLNRVAISAIRPDRVTVSGRIQGMWAKISFANVRGCPRI